MQALGIYPVRMKSILSSMVSLRLWVVAIRLYEIKYWQHLADCRRGWGGADVMAAAACEAAPASDRSARYPPVTCLSIVGAVRFHP